MAKNMTPELLARVAARFRALSDEARLRLLLHLRQGPATVGELVEATGLAQPSVSKHLGVLREVGIVASRREGTAVVNHIRDPAVFDLCDIVCNGVRTYHAEINKALRTNRPLNFEI
jgi:DNA-binding transcriptional ArsR family regulator